jgi:hypothetical protein
MSSYVLPASPDIIPIARFCTLSTLGSPCLRPAMATMPVHRTPGVGGHTGCRGGEKHAYP